VVFLSHEDAHFKQAIGEIRKVSGGFQGVCPKCGAMGPKRKRHDEALEAWNDRELKMRNA
jgi:hypothetical protein